MHVDGSRSPTDLLIVLTGAGFWPVIGGILKQKIELHSPPQDNIDWNWYPPVIRAPIQDVQEAVANTKYEPKEDSVPEPLVNVLSDMFNMNSDEYWEAFLHWMEDHMLEHEVAQKWWAAYNQDWPYYMTVL